MSSFELLELFGVDIDDDEATKTRTISIEFAPDQGMLAKAMRRGGWSEQQQAVFQIANELAVLRASQVQGVDADVYGSRLFIPPQKVRERTEWFDEVAEGRAAIFGMTAVDNVDFDDAEGD